MADFRNFRARAERAFPGVKPSQALERVRAIVGSKAAMPPNEEGKLAVAALEKLQDPALPEPTPAELAALELMIRITRRRSSEKGGQTTSRRSNSRKSSRTGTFFKNPWGRSRTPSAAWTVPPAVLR
jgi:hypothetical protein